MTVIFQKLDELPGWLQSIVFILVGLIPVVTVIQLLIIQNISVYNTIPWAVVPVAILLYVYTRLLNSEVIIPKHDSVKRRSGIEISTGHRRILIFLVISILILFTSAIVSVGFAFTPTESPQMQFLKLFRQLPFPVAIPLLFMLALTAGIVEEIIFRGWIQKVLIQRYGTFIGIVGVGLLFTLVHFLPKELFLPYFLVSVFFSLTAISFKSTLPGIIAHALFDFIAFCLFYFDASITTQTYFENNWMLNLMLTLVSAGLIAWICRRQFALKT